MKRVSSGSDFEAQVGYSRAVCDGDMVYVSGTTGFDYATMTIANDAPAQCRQALANISSALGAVGATLDDVVRVRYMAPVRPDFEACWPVLAEAFGETRPAATFMNCELLDPAMRIEIEVTARIGAGATLRDAETIVLLDEASTRADPGPDAAEPAE